MSATSSPNAFTTWKQTKSRNLVAVHPERSVGMSGQSNGAVSPLPNQLGRPKPPLSCPLEPPMFMSVLVWVILGT